MRTWLYGLVVESFAGINIVTEDCGPEWRHLGWRLASRLWRVRIGLAILPSSPMFASR
jgi:hypothetical protein